MSSNPFYEKKDYKMKRCVDMYIFLIKHLAKKDFITLHSALIFSNVVPKHIFSADRNELMRERMRLEKAQKNNAKERKKRERKGREKKEERRKNKIKRGRNLFWKQEGPRQHLDW